VCSLNYFLHVYTQLADVSFYNSRSDGYFLIVPQLGLLHIVTEFGHGGLYVEPLEIVALQVNMIELFPKRHMHLNL